ncbi:ABC transporter ATP-binding protein [Limnohabitans sp. Rim8]|jgi:ABC-type sugar transport system ATPase subunit|uniref:ABC transporter ATP-binding protein n=1 Tax=Limnohabitans sp. Rim8 TaxID=1100718 RepID=UPI0033058552
MNKQGAVKLTGVGKSFGQTSVLREVDLEIRPGEFFSLLGPSGSGKTTTLRIIAGLETASAGYVYLDDIDATLTPPGDRDVAMVFQSYALYPHMSVFDNIAFPLKMIRMPAAAIAITVQEAAARVRIDHLLTRRPGQLSGGQQQRCALARAIVRKPALFLLDEPLSNLDAKLRVETRVELRRLQRALNVTTVYVTHDQEEAMSMSDRLAVFMDGRIVQIGTPEEVYGQPATVEVAAFLGNPPMNLLPTQLVDGIAIIGDARIATPHLAGLGQRDVMLGIRPSEVTLGTEGLAGTVTLCELLGDDMIVDLDVGGLLLRVKATGRKRIAEGERVHAHFAVERLHVFDKASGTRIAI